MELTPEFACLYGVEVDLVFVLGVLWYVSSPIA